MSPRYIPDGLLGCADNLSEDGKLEVNTLNQQIVQHLKSSDSAFSLGKRTVVVLVVGGSASTVTFNSDGNDDDDDYDDDGDVDDDAGVTESGVNCIRFGLVTHDTDLEELIAVVLKTGREVEESSKVGN